MAIHQANINILHNFFLYFSQEKNLIIAFLLYLSFFFSSSLAVCSRSNLNYKAHTTKREKEREEKNFFCFLFFFFFLLLAFTIHTIFFRRCHLKLSYLLAFCYIKVQIAYVNYGNKQQVKEHDFRANLCVRKKNSKLFNE